MDQPLRSGEAMQMQYLYAFAQCMQDMEGPLKKRLQSSGNMKRFHTVQTLVAKMIVELMATVPQEKVELFERNLRSQEIKIQTKHVSDQDDGYTLIRSDDLIDLCKLAAEWTCATCGDTKEEMSKCPFRKITNRSFMVEIPKRFNNCAFKGFDWEEQRK